MSLKKLFFIFIIFSLTVFSNPSSPTIDQQVTGVNLQQLEYRAITNSNELLKNQKIESTNMEIVGDSLKKQRQRIKVVQSDSVQLQGEIIEGRKKGFFGTLFGL
ncbi:MAG: hypothetical protein ACRCTS_01360 [Fusobacteriaceae bacterium]